MLKRKTMDPLLSIVIISMNNILDVKECINSINKYHNVERYDIYLLAYNYSQKNLIELKENYKSLNIVESYGVKGFAENNNLALKLIKGKYCLILNDDTYFKDNTLDKMLNMIVNNSGIKILSPHILNTDGSSQILGWPKYNVLNYMLHEIKLRHFSFVGDTNLQLFKTYSVCSACFMIETNLFKKLGFFDEKYFFTPEDIALSSKAISSGCYPYVYQDAQVYHKGSETAKNIHQITIPVAKQGIYLYFREFYGRKSELIVRLYVMVLALFKYLYWLLLKKKSPRRTIMLSANINSVFYSLKNIDPKVMFENFTKNSN